MIRMIITVNIYSTKAERGAKENNVHTYKGIMRKETKLRTALKTHFISNLVPVVG